MRLSDFDYNLPQELIAQKPAERREGSRMLIVDRSTNRFRDSSFNEFPDLLRSDDILVLNNTRVFPARLIGQRKPGGGQIEMFLVRRLEMDEISNNESLRSISYQAGDEIWEVLAKPGRSLRTGSRASFGESLNAEVLAQLPAGRRVVRFDSVGKFEEIIDRIGSTPLPPYIKRKGDSENRLDHERYQTVYATERGAIAAPTAGLHFTPAILAAIRGKGVEVIQITHHVGYGTFQPVRVEEISEHHIEAETYTISADAAEKLSEAKLNKKRIIAVGTTTTRALESAVDSAGRFHSGKSSTELYIYPGYQFRAVDCLLTNFHLPQSSLLMLVSALAGHKLIMDAYAHAVQERYRFYSYGDCMFIF
ncbi:MAG TPA: tRNA preQ1(34) S-adenosylmethionine ribosyltransferase-isomerase QueA [Blastocatellia bacterium]|nr:tRNA preQ1(34) S-adenosylmethionine ribosyltransferase-isomerase QueA [Blastocatellia bacterium]